MTTYRRPTVDGHRIFYREAGRPDAPTLLLLHGFPTSSHMFRDLIPLLADRFHVVAPDLPGFGLTTMPDRAMSSRTPSTISPRSSTGSPRSSASSASPSTSSTTARRSASGWRWRTRSASPPSSRRTATPTRKG